MPIITPPPRSDELASGLIHLNRQRSMYLTDVYASLLKMKWRYLLLLFAFSYLAINATFATVYFATGNCIKGADPNSWWDAFHFSVQTLSTIGYGGMTPMGTTGDSLVAIQSWLGILVVALFTGIVFSKFARPTARIQFSRVAVVHNYNGVPSLVFRLANERGSNIIEANLRATILLEERTAEGETMRKLHDLKVIRQFHPVLIMSWMVVHPIDEESPLYGLTEEDMQDRFARIIVSMSGVDGIFLQVTHTHYHYNTEHIIWNAKLVNVIKPQEDGSVILDFRHFHDYMPLSPESPMCCHISSTGSRRDEG